jgi:hypothetical protein
MLGSAASLLDQEKTPAAGWQTRERVNWRASSVDTPSYNEEGDRDAHPPTLAPTEACDQERYDLLVSWNPGCFALEVVQVRGSQGRRESHCGSGATSSPCGEQCRDTGSYGDRGERREVRAWAAPSVKRPGFRGTHFRPGDVGSRNEASTETHAGPPRVGQWMHGGRPVPRLVSPRKPVSSGLCLPHYLPDAQPHHQPNFDAVSGSCPPRRRPDHERHRPPRR